MVNFPLFAGMAAAALHVVSGPDHLAAVTPLAIETRRKVWKIGLFWGFGHLVGMLLIGLLFMTFREFIPIEKISGHSEQLVGVVLIAIGPWASFFCGFGRTVVENQIFMPKFCSAFCLSCVSLSYRSRCIDIS